MPNPSSKLELVCPAGTPESFYTAIDAGADTVYCGFRNETNARNFPGLNFNEAELKEAIKYAHIRNRKVLVAINTYPTAGKISIWHKSIDCAARVGADAVILADIGLLHYCQKNHPNLRRHLSVQAAASTAESIAFYANHLGVERVVLPRVLTLDEIEKINSQTSIETEIFAFGGLCVMAEGRCSLSSYATGKSPNKNGVCSPAEHVCYRPTAGGGLKTQLGSVTLNTITKGEQATYPTICKGRYHFNNQLGYLFEEPTSLNVLPILDQIQKSGVTALKIEGRQRGRAYIRQIVSTFREAIDQLSDQKPLPDTSSLQQLTEGGTETTGPYQKSWH